jgi:lipase maturation factor 1
MDWTDWTPAVVIRWFLDSRNGPSGRFLARWLFLRGLGVIYFSAFYSLVYQVRGLIGPDGILPAGPYLQEIAQQLGRYRFWYAPTVFWFSSSAHALSAVCWIGMIAALLLVLNLWPRGMLLIGFICFLSFVAAAGEFSGYQSDGMLLEAGFLSLFFAPPGFRPRLGINHPPIRAALYLLIWEWFRIYFESGVAKVMSGDPQWRNFTALDDYYQNGPLPTWIGWYAAHLPHWFHQGTTGLTLGLELFLIWAVFLPRRFRIILFFIVTPWQIGIILTANYTFLNYLVLWLGFLLLDDRFLCRFFSAKWREQLPSSIAQKKTEAPASIEAPLGILTSPFSEKEPFSVTAASSTFAGKENWWPAFRAPLAPLRIGVLGVLFVWIFYATTVQMVWGFGPVPFPTAPISLLEPFRIANRYGHFAVMTRGRYEIEFQGSNDGQTWTAYPFRHKPQDVTKPPRIYAPYQPRFDWNLWFASLGEWHDNPMVLRTEWRLLANDRDVLSLFAYNPFPNAPPRQVRAVLWQYWFTTVKEKHATGDWWRRELLGLYAPALEEGLGGRVEVTQWPVAHPLHGQD